MGRGIRPRAAGPRSLNCLIDTHILVWVVLGSRRLGEFPWLDRYRPWGVSPVSLLEIQLLAETGKVGVRNPEFSEAVMSDPRFEIDEAPLLALVRHALPLDWTRDPFDRLLAAHSLARRVPFCTADRRLLEHHRLVPRELQ